MESIKEAWSGILDYLHRQEDISDVAFNVWLNEIEPQTINDTAVVVFVQTNFQQKIVTEHYAEKIKTAFKEVLGLSLDLTVLSHESEDTIAVDMNQPEAVNITGTHSPDYEYSFENFIVGSSNKFAYAASQAVANKPAGYYNPLFIYGGPGLGKTHLLYAICNQIRKNNPSVNLIYTKGEYITNELIEALANNTMQDFRTKYRQIDVLLVDDIQFIAGKTSTQEEFFHTFDALHQANKQIVLTSDRPPKEISTLAERLRNRFEMGLLADIQPPDLETRIAIIKRKAQLLDFYISDSVATYMADQLKNNVRQLEGAVKRMHAQYLLGGDQPSIITAQNAIRDIRSDTQPETVTVDNIIHEVARTFNVSPEDIRSSKRSSEISQARQVSAYVIKEILDMSMKKIGENFGSRDHSTIVYAIHKVETRMANDSSYRGMIKDIIKNIREE